MDDRMRFWLSFSVSPVTSAPVLLRLCVYMKLSPDSDTPTLSERLPPGPATTMPLMEPSDMTLPPAVCARLDVCMICGAEERKGQRLSQQLAPCCPSAPKSLPGHHCVAYPHVACRRSSGRIRD